MKYYFYVIIVSMNWLLFKIVAKIKLERDSLLGENERLCFQLQMMSEIVTNRK
jgi:hypothetical protein